MYKPIANTIGRPFPERGLPVEDRPRRGYETALFLNAANLGAKRLGVRWETVCAMPINPVEIIALLLLATVPAGPYVVIYLIYRRKLTAKRHEVLCLVSRGEAVKYYAAIATGHGTSRSRARSRVGSATHQGDARPSAPDPGTAVEALFERYFDTKLYVIALLPNIAIITAAAALALARAWFPGMAGQIWSEVLVSVLGAYVWNIYDLVQRYNSGELAPESLHFAWVRLVVAAAIGPVLSHPFPNPDNLVVSFGAGVLPLKDVFEIISNWARRLLGVGPAAHIAARTGFEDIQGMTPELVESLSANGIVSAAHLAYADPLRLLFKTNVEWVVIIDVIDQALLAIYLEDKVARLRPKGIRGAIEFARIAEDLVLGNALEIDRAKEFAKAIAASIEQDSIGTENLAQTMWEDTRVQLIWDLWGETGDKSKAAGR